MPSLAEFPAPPEIRRYEHEPVIEQRPPAHRIRGCQVDAVASVSVEESGVFSVELRALPTDDAQRHFRAVLRDSKFANHLRVAEIRRALLGKSGPSCVSRRGIEPVP